MVTKLNFSAVSGLCVFILTTSYWLYQYNYPYSLSPIRIGVIHSLTGTMAQSEQPLVDILSLEVEEINTSGGLLGRQIEMIVADSRSNAEHAAKEVKKLILNEKVDVIFGCWTSSCRKAVKPIVEKYQSILFYPVQYEGLEESKNIIYTGAAPNQQIIPGINWALKNFGKRVYLIGSNYIFPRAANVIVRDIVQLKKAEVVGEKYVDLGSSNFESVISDILALRPDVVLNTVNGDSNKYLFSNLKLGDLEDIPVVSFSFSETELTLIEQARNKNHYAVWNYFQSIERDENTQFIEKIKQKLGRNIVISDPMEATYIAFRIWVQSVVRARTSKPKVVIKHTDNQTFNSPGGIVSVDNNNHHLRKIVRIGPAREDGQFDIVWESAYAMRPVPFPTYRNKHEWRLIVDKLPKK